jgi:hypothetical protein
MWDTLSDERMHLLFIITAGPCQCSHSLVTDSKLPKLKAQVPIFISPTNRVAQLYPQALGSLFVTSCDSQSYSGSIQTHFHVGIDPESFVPSMLII